MLLQFFTPMPLIAGGWTSLSEACRRVHLERESFSALQVHQAHSGGLSSPDPAGRIEISALPSLDTSPPPYAGQAYSAGASLKPESFNDSSQSDGTLRIGRLQLVCTWRLPFLLAQSKGAYTTFLNRVGIRRKTMAPRRGPGIWINSPVNVCARRTPLGPSLPSA